MFKRRHIVLLGMLAAGIFLIAYAFANKQKLIREYMTSAPPTVISVQKDLEQTQKKLDTLNTEFQTMKTQAQAQAQEAAAAKASLAAIH